MSNIVDLNEQNFAEVLNQSRQMPVLLDFWADWCEPCKALAPVLEKLANEYADQFILAKINADQQQAICMQLGVQSLPTLKLIVQGQIAGELVGAQPESAIRQLLEPHLGAAGDNPEEAMFIEQIRQACAAGQQEQVVEALNRVLAERPDAHALRAEMIRVLLDLGRIDEARQHLSALPEDHEDRKGFELRIGFIDQAADLPDTLALMDALEKNPDDLEARYNLAILSLSKGEAEQALEGLLEVMAKDAGFDEGKARKTLLDVFEALGKSNPLVSQYRRKMYNLLY